MTPELQDDELLRSYLLGKLPEEDADTLEQRLLAEDDLFDLAEAVEMDLLAAADRGAFTLEEREEVLRKLAATPRGLERLAFARSLNTVADETDVARTVVPFPPRTQPFPRPVIHWMALAASLVMVTGLGWFAWQNREQAPDTTRRITVLTPAPAPRPLPPSPTPAPSLPTKMSKSSPNRPAIKKVPTAVMTLSFLNVRGDEAGQRLELSPDDRRVEIQIYDVDGDAKSFDVVVRSRAQGTSIMEKKGLKPRALLSGRGLVLRIPAEQFPEGRYEIAVTPQGGEETVQDFEVVEVKR